MAFAGAFTDLFDEMRHTSFGQPEAPARVPTALETFQMEWDSNMNDEYWQFAGIEDLYKYFRKNKRLRIPDEWKALVPKSLDPQDMPWISVSH